MRLEEIREINGIHIGIFRLSYHPSATANAGRSLNGYVWSPLDENDKRTTQPDNIFDSYFAALNDAEKKLGNDSSD